MKFVLITKDPELVDEAQIAFQHDELQVFAGWREALDGCEGASLMFVDLLATLDEPHKIAGYERFALAKMGHEIAKEIPLVLIAAPADYELDFMSGWPDFVLAQIRRPVSEKIFRRAATWI